MNKKINISIILSCILCIFPSILSIFIHDKLPESLPIHFNFNGDVNLYGNKFFVCFILPLIFLCLNILLNIGLNNDPNKINHNIKLLNIVRFITPVISLLFISISIFVSLDFKIRVENIFSIFFSITFILIGNYMPKCKQNYTMGIRVPWTLNNKNN